MKNEDAQLNANLAKQHRLVLLILPILGASSIQRNIVTHPSEIHSFSARFS